MQTIKFYPDGAAKIPPAAIFPIYTVPHYTEFNNTCLVFFHVEQSCLDDNGNEGLHDSPSQHQRALNEEAGMGEDDGENEEEGEEGEEEEEGDEGESANNNVKVRNHASTLFYLCIMYVLLSP